MIVASLAASGAIAAGCTTEHVVVDTSANTPGGEETSESRDPETPAGLGRGADASGDGDGGALPPYDGGALHDAQVDASPAPSKEPTKPNAPNCTTIAVACSAGGAMEHCVFYGGATGCSHVEYRREVGCQSSLASYRSYGFCP